MRRRHIGRPLLVASIGVATVAYAACGGDNTGNLMPPHVDASVKDSSFGDASVDSAVDATEASSDSTVDAPSEATADAASDSPNDARDGD